MVWSQLTVRLRGRNSNDGAGFTIFPGQHYDWYVTCPSQSRMKLAIHHTLLPRAFPTAALNHQSERTENIPTLIIKTPKS